MAREKTPRSRKIGGGLFCMKGVGGTRRDASGEHAPPVLGLVERIGWDVVPRGIMIPRTALPPKARRFVSARTLRLCCYWLGKARLKTLIGTRFASLATGLLAGKDTGVSGEYQAVAGNGAVG